MTLHAPTSHNHQNRLGMTITAQASMNRVYHSPKPSITHRRAPSTRLGTGRQYILSGQGAETQVYMTSVQRAEAWGTGQKRGGSSSYVMQPSVLNRNHAPKYEAGVGGMGGHITVFGRREYEIKFQRKRSEEKERRGWSG